jgi:hypothetical protein
MTDFYPGSVLEPKVRFGLEEILGNALEAPVAEAPVATCGSGSTQS